MAHHFQDVNLSADPLNVVDVRDLALIQQFYRNLKDTNAV